MLEEHVKPPSNPGAVGLCRGWESWNSPARHVQILENLRPSAPRHPVRTPMQHRRRAASLRFECPLRVWCGGDRVDVLLTAGAEKKSKNGIQGVPGGKIVTEVSGVSPQRLLDSP